MGVRRGANAHVTHGTALVDDKRTSGRGLLGLVVLLVLSCRGIPPEKTAAPPVAAAPSAAAAPAPEPTAFPPPPASAAAASPPKPSEVSEPAAPTKAYLETRVYYGTDRARTGSDEPYSMFGTERGDLTLGACQVAIPRDHKPGVLETHGWWKFRLHDKPSNDVTLLRVEPMSLDTFAKELSQRVAASARKSALVFIHGYNTTFAESVRRTAQIAFDLNFDGAAIAYSWPSRGELVPYVADATNAEWTGPDLHTFLHLVASQTGATEASLIVHSMGNRALASAMNDLARNPAIGTMKIREIVLAAPDIDRDTFVKQIAPAFAPTGARVTLYASDHDEALEASRKLSMYPRAGDTRGGIVIASGIESVDASDADHTLLGHTYFANSKVLSDIHDIISDHRAPDERKRLGSVTVPSGGKYWRFLGNITSMP